MDKQAMLEQYISLYMTTFKYIGDLVSEPMKEYGISFEQFLMMRDLANGQQLAVSELAKKRGVTKGAISRQLKILMNQNYVLQARSDVDRRIFYLHLTSTGEALTVKINAVILQRFSNWLDIIGEHDANELRRIMDRVGHDIIEQEQDDSTPKS